ncbi:MAG: hypothetical protein KA717_27560 [Woronichinia naegeliana WA131]|jgi:hypothetical protein|uniref:Uncharacterized protein n=1 Tax=Woronichinia naegeliana WA131 TaxID=2824559 RepID=A0A977PUN7_9CYAN|nr:MAG: hypothetical protein KA717_27560 [Woronichinia naegeliana WA131]
MSNPTLEICPVCGVKIENGAKVIFSAGPSGTRSRLWARVCNFAKNPDCINQDEAIAGNIVSNDYYQ